MAKTRLIGYIVRASENGIMYGHAKRLYFTYNRKAILFPTRRAALNAIKATINSYDTQFPGESFVRNFGDVYAIPVRTDCL